MEGFQRGSERGTESIRATEAASAPLRSHGPRSWKSQETSHLSVGTINRLHLCPQAQLQPHSFWQGWRAGKEALGAGKGRRRGKGAELESKTYSLVIADGWVTSAACFAAKEVHRFTLSFPSKQKPSQRSNSPQWQNAIDPGSIRHLRNITPHSTHRMIFFIFIFSPSSSGSSHFINHA